MKAARDAVRFERGWAALRSVVARGEVAKAASAVQNRSAVCELDASARALCMEADMRQQQMVVARERAANDGKEGGSPMSSVYGRNPAASRPASAQVRRWTRIVSYGARRMWAATCGVGRWKRVGERGTRRGGVYGQEGLDSRTSMEITRPSPWMRRNGGQESGDDAADAEGGAVGPERRRGAVQVRMHWGRAGAARMWCVGPELSPCSVKNKMVAKSLALS
ncbi:hypothetical protein GGX14DRAFT_398530 [Mycena pura]|uniref:Uncharacterized protein n=1 Tax=Mycena pura TaxID=153505 RepID=A0AAD6VD92_9AGAR|nr:hypothetical protein GGX14DRAFT_398530 [Mycena pura]